MLQEIISCVTLHLTTVVDLPSILTWHLVNSKQSPYHCKSFKAHANNLIIHAVPKRKRIFLRHLFLILFHAIFVAYIGVAMKKYQHIETNTDNYLSLHIQSEQLTKEYNSSPYEDVQKKKKILEKLFGFIDKNSIIGAGSVVTKDIPDNCIAVGNPCKPVKYFDDIRKNKI